jgi:hypothetical protein
MKMCFSTTRQHAVIFNQIQQEMGLQTRDNTVAAKKKVITVDL